MNDLQVFTDPAFGSIRTAVIDSEPWFVGKDVARAMGYKNPRDALNRHVDPEDRGASCFTTPYGDQSMTVINESGILEFFDGKRVLSLDDVRRYTGMVDDRTLKRHFPFQGRIISAATLARCLSGGDTDG